MDWATFVVRTTIANPLAVASALRKEISRTRPEFSVVNVHTQSELVERQTVRERLLALLSLFFALVAVALAGIGLYGILTSSVLRRRREIGIRIALGARRSEVARHVSVEALSLLLPAAIAGLAAGIASQRYFESLLFQVRGSDPMALAIPALTICTAGALAALAPLVRAVRTDPTAMLRVE